MFSKQQKIKQSIYLDYAAATPVDPLVEKVMRPFWGTNFGNPSSLYRQGIEAKRAIEAARKNIAEIISAGPAEIIFTAGGTESCNLAIFGIAKNFASTKKIKPHIITTSIEHHAVLRPVEALKKEGYNVTVLPVDRKGLVTAADVEKAVRKETILISIMYANNEIGTIEPIAEIGKMLAKVNLIRVKNKLPKIIFHTDACQAASSLDLNVNKLNVDLMSVNGSKIYGPKQTGFLFVRTGTNLKPLIYGGGQENNLRSGTENVAGIVGIAQAVELVQANKEIVNAMAHKLQNNLIGRLLKIDGVTLNGPSLGGSRLLNNINIQIKGVEGESLVLYLDAIGVAVSTGSACSTALAETSHVLRAIGLSEAQSKSCIRISLGKHTDKSQIDYLLKVLPGLIKQLRKVKTFNK